MKNPAEATNYAECFDDHPLEESGAASDRPSDPQKAPAVPVPYGPLFTVLDSIAKSSPDTGYQGTHKDHMVAITFMDANGWFGLDPDRPHSESDYAGLFGEDGPHRQRVLFWFRAYGRSVEEKNQLILSKFTPSFPETCAELHRFLSEKDLLGSMTGLQVTDFLFSAPLTKEITRYDDPELKTLIQESGSCLGPSSFSLLQDFLWSLKPKGLKMLWHYELEHPSLMLPSTTAYPILDFAKINYYVFNQDAWKEHELVKKAEEDRICANVWGCIAIALITPARRTDVASFPVPRTDCFGRDVTVEEAVRRVVHGKNWEADAYLFASSWMSQVNMLGLVPNKTKAYSGVPSLDFFIPEPLLTPVGVIIALVLKHHREGESFLCTDLCSRRLVNMFGTEFSAIVGGSGFSVRRAAKSQLQGLEAIAGADKPGRMDGYLIASRARCHKGGLGRISDVTDIYLRDQTFTGYRPDYILFHMFCRGICGFVPVLLMEKYDEKAFRSLSVQGQTDLIQAIGLSAWQIEEITQISRRALRKAECAVAEVLRGTPADASDRDSLKRRVSSILLKAASGGANAKDPRLYCLRIAAGQDCPFPDRSSCIGCGYEIYTKALMQSAVTEFMRLKKRMDASGEEEALRCRHLAIEGILPVMQEILETLPMLYPDTDKTVLHQIMDACIRESKEGEK